jgi:hypothetical protein
MSGNPADETKIFPSINWTAYFCGSILRLCKCNRVNKDLSGFKMDLFHPQSGPDPTVHFFKKHPMADNFIKIRYLLHKMAMF